MRIGVIGSMHFTLRQATSHKYDSGRLSVTFSSAIYRMCDPELVERVTEKMVEACVELQKLGHQAFVTSLAPPYLGKSDAEKDRLKYEDQMERDAIREFWRLMQGADAVLAMNFDRNGIRNYIGGNTFLEMGFAHVLGQQIFLFHPIPEILYRAEIDAMRPVVIHGDYSRIPL